MPLFPAMSFQFLVVKVTRERCTRIREAAALNEEPNKIGVLLT
jgi:hypothetical protein